MLDWMLTIFLFVFVPIYSAGFFYMLTAEESDLPEASVDEALPDVGKGQLPTSKEASTTSSYRITKKPSLHKAPNYKPPKFVQVLHAQPPKPDALNLFSDPKSEYDLTGRLDALARALFIFGWMLIALGCVSVPLWKTWAQIWFLVDGAIVLLVAWVLEISVEKKLRICSEEKQIIIEARNPFYTSVAVVEAGEIADVIVCGKFFSWPLLIPVGKLRLGLSLILKDARKIDLWIKLNDSAIELPQRYQSLLCLQSYVSETFGLNKVGSEGFSQATHELSVGEFAQDHDPDVVAHRWKAMASGFSFTSSTPGTFRVDITTKRESRILKILSSLFILSTIWILMAAWGILQRNPRLFYLILLDSTSVIATLLGLAGLIVNDQLEFDLQHRAIYLRKRLFWRRNRVKLCNFEDVWGAWVVKCQPKFGDFFTEYFATLELENGKTIRISDTYCSPEISKYRVGHIRRLLDLPKRSPRNR